jgi:putative ABC transport system substrate-binding protein
VESNSPGARKELARLVHPPHQVKREVDHEVTDEHAISFRFDCTIEPVMIHTPEELDAAFPAMEKSRPDAIIVQPSLPIKRFPTMVGWRRSPSAEGRYSVAERQLGSPYVAAETDMYRRAAALVDKVLKRGVCRPCFLARAVRPRSSGTRVRDEPEQAWWQCHWHVALSQLREELYRVTAHSLDFESARLRWWCQ